MLKILVIILATMFGLAVLISGSFALYMRHYLYSHKSPNQEIEFTIKKGEGVRIIAGDLKQKKLISHDLPFIIYLKYKGISGQLLAGEYRIKLNLTPMEIIDILTSGRVASQRITIPEGWTNDQMADYLAKKKIVTKTEFLAAVKKNYNYSFLSSKPKDGSLEGFLFPDTYQISYHATAEEIIKIMLNNFEKKLSPQIQEEVKGSGYSLYEILTLASVVEREVSKPEDRKVVAGIFLSRLKEDMPLQSDVTVLYALGLNEKNLTDEELKTPSPYNTYLYRGLPIGPINNPSLNSIEAVLNPVITEYRYFLAADGNVYYSKTLTEHQAKVVKYLR